jgi:tRNA(fMet)-specific endonuclease VapC
LKFFLDTNICIYYLNGQYETVQKKLLSKHPMDVRIASIVRAELLYGARKSRHREQNEEIIKRFLQPFEIAPFGAPEAEMYAEIRATLEQAGKIIGPNDLILAATVLANGGILVTNNENEFKRVKSLKTENWTKPRL